MLNGFWDDEDKFSNTCGEWRTSAIFKREILKVVEEYTDELVCVAPLA